MDKTILLQSIITKSELMFSRSSGPGGQNVNKVNSRTQLKIALSELEGISEEEKSLLLVKLQSRLVDGVLQVTVQDERSQLLNRELAIDRTMAIIVESLHRPKIRRKTKPTKASKERRLTSKKTTSIHKANRSRPLNE
ncbi:MAG: alternative ribosome rescue aminoacyl-tRNA hydrolase ArfB [Spirochaetota bacterium]